MSVYFLTDYSDRSMDIIISDLPPIPWSRLWPLAHYGNPGHVA
jgi:hypothetical protein